MHKRLKNSIWANSEAGGYTEYNSEKVGWSETPAIAEIAATERFDCERVPFRHANSKYGYKSLKNKWKCTSYKLTETKHFLINFLETSTSDFSFYHQQTLPSIKIREKSENAGTY